MSTAWLIAVVFICGAIILAYVAHGVGNELTEAATNGAVR